jgi:small GTP-binding protein
MDQNMTEPQYLKAVILGNDGVGKTSLILAYSRGQSPYDDVYIPLVTDVVTIENYEHRGKVINLSIWDTSSGIDYESHLHQSYIGADVLVFLFSVVCDSDIRFEMTVSRWLRDIHHHSQDLPIIFVGSQCDMRQHYRSDVLTKAKCKAMALNNGAARYMEVSTLNNEGVTELFNEVVRIGYKRRAHNIKDEGRNCLLL